MGVTTVIAGIRQGHSGLVIELDENHRVVDAIIERRHRIELPNPGEDGFAEMLVDFVEPRFRMCSRQPVGIELDLVGEQNPLRRRHIGYA